MESLSALQQIVSTLGGAGSIVALMVVAVLYKQGFFKKGNGNGNSDEMLKLMIDLKSHYNDETTDLLREIRDISKTALEESKQANTKLLEFEKYGIKMKR